MCCQRGRGSKCCLLYWPRSSVMLSVICPQGPALATSLAGARAWVTHAQASVGFKGQYGCLCYMLNCIEARHLTIHPAYVQSQAVCKVRQTYSLQSCWQITSLMRGCAACTNLDVISPKVETKIFMAARWWHWGSSKISGDLGSTATQQLLFHPNQPIHTIHHIIDIERHAPLFCQQGSPLGQTWPSADQFFIQSGGDST